MKPDCMNIPAWRAEETPQPRLYHEFASWWPLLSSPDDYVEEAEFYRHTLTDACSREPRSLLELGAGGGNNAFHLKAHFGMTLVDLSAGMLAVSRNRNPECTHVQGDMRSIDLGQEFDGVFIHDAIVYMTTPDDLQRVIETAYAHCREGGVLLIVPDHTRETFASTTGHGGLDGSGRSLRYLQWEWDPDPCDDTYLTDFLYLLREQGGALRVEFDRHVCGLFDRNTWCRLIRQAGFTPQVLPFEHSEVEEGACEVFVGTKPSPSSPSA